MKVLRKYLLISNQLVSQINLKNSSKDFNKSEKVIIHRMIFNNSDSNLRINQQLPWNNHHKLRLKMILTNRNKHKLNKEVKEESNKIISNSKDQLLMLNILKIIKNK